MPNPVLRVTTYSGAVYEFSEGMAFVRVNRKVYDPSNDSVLHAHEWYPCAYAAVEMGYGMRLGFSGSAMVHLSTPVVRIEGV